MNKICNVASILALLFILLSVFNGTKWIFHKETQYLSFSELPQDLKLIIKDYRVKAKENGVDTEIIDNMVFILYSDPKVSHGGFGFQSIPVMGIRYQENMPYFIKKEKVWHELGHIILHYGHETEIPHIMNYGTKLNHKNNVELEKGYFKDKVPYFSNFKGILTTTVYHVKTMFSKI